MVAKELESLFAVTRFRCDGRVLTVRWVNTSKSGHTFKLAVYIDDRIQPGKGWLNSDFFDPFVVKIWRKRTYTVTLFKRKTGESRRSLAAVARLKKQFPDKVIVYYDSLFSSASSLIRQYRLIEGLEYVEKEAENG